MTPSAQAYLEKDLPLEKLHDLALKEAHSRKPIYQIHKWWARRPAAVFRTMIIAAFSDSVENEQTIWDRYSNGYNLQGKVILDPFLGGGTTAIEALKIGCKVVGVDVNPVAWFVTKKEIEPFDRELALTVFKKMEGTIGRNIKQLYITKCPSGHNAGAVYFLWIQIITCPHCNLISRLFRDCVVAERDDARHAVCPKCGAILKTAAALKTIHCRRCLCQFRPLSGVVNRGVFTCPQCSHAVTLRDAARQNSGPLPAEMFAVEYDCKSCGHGFKEPDESDRRLYSSTSSMLKKKYSSLPIPKELISENRNDPRPISHGYKAYRDLFNDRQLLCLGLLLRHIGRIKEKNIREFFLLAFSSALETNSRLCKYESKWGKVSPIFSIPGYHPVERFAENNVWGLSRGRGTFVKSFNKLLRGKAHSSNSFERVFSKTATMTRQLGENSSTEIADSFQELLTGPQRALLLCQSSESLEAIPDKSIDAIITDPPYFDNINYWELADFFYVWLRLLLKDHYSNFSLESSCRPGQVVAKNNSSDEVKMFVKGLSSVLLQCSRVLRDDGIMAFTFHHSNPNIWLGIRGAIEVAGFVVSGVHVVRSEGSTGFRKDGNTDVDACLVFRKRSSRKSQRKSTSIKTLSLRELGQDSQRLAQRLRKVGGPIRESNLRTLVYAKSLRCNAEEVCRTEGLQAYADNFIKRLEQEAPSPIAYAPSVVSRNPL